MGIDLTWDADQLPGDEELRAQLRGLPAAQGRPLTDVQLDLRDGVDPDLAPRRVTAKRRPKAKGKAAAKAQNAPRTEARSDSAGRE